MSDSKKKNNVLIPASLRMPNQQSGVHGRLLSTVVLALAATGVQANAAEGSNSAKSKKAQSKTTSTQLEEVVVNAVPPTHTNPYADPDAPYKVDRSASEKFAKPLLDTSKSITAIPKEVIKDSAATSLKDVMRMQPGVTIGTGEGGNAFGDRFIIRGFEARNDIFVDGVRDPGVVSREIFAIEQVEIAKGPSSTFAGRGSTGAAVNLVSKAPAPEQFREAELSIGTANTKRAALDINEPINDAIALRFNGVYHDAGVAGRDQVFNERKGAALAASFKPNDRVGLNLDYYHLNSDALPDWGVPYDLPNNRPFDVDRDNFYGLVGRDFWNVNSDIATAKLSVALNDAWRVTSVARYGDTGNAYVVSAPERPTATTVQASAKTLNQNNRTWANQTHLIGSLDQGDFHHDLILGFEFGNERAANRPYMVDPRAVTQDLLNPDPDNWSGTVIEGPNVARKEIDTRALYAMDTMTLNEHWQLFGGVRYDNYDIDSVSIVNDYVNEASRLTNDSDFVNWHAGVVYKPVEFGSVYFSLSSSSNPSGEQLDAGAVDYGGLGASNSALDPERNKSMELGTKWNLSGDNLLLTVALFQIDKENARVNTGGGMAGPQMTTLDGEMRVQGGEIGLAGMIGERWSVFGGLTLLDTEVLSSRDSNQVGKSFPNVAEKSFNLQAKYAVTQKLTIGGASTYTDEIFGGTAYALNTRIPGHWRWDLLAEYQATERLGLQLNVLNLTDKVYYDALYRSATPFVYIAPGRSALFSVEYEF